MRLRSLHLPGGGPGTAALAPDGTWRLVDGTGAVDDVLRSGVPAELIAEQLTMFSPVPDGATLAPLVRAPDLLLGIGLNYREHAGDLSERPPSEPASFLKGRHTLVAAGAPIVVPAGSTRVTAEAELGLIIGVEAWQVSESAALRHVAGVCLVLDQTEENVLRRNPRFLTRAKNYPTFLCLGPDLISLDEVGPLRDLVVRTRRGGEERRNTVANMMFSPEYLVAFHSRVMPLRPGDVISTGTPGALVIRDGDTVTCTIDGLGSLTCPVTVVPAGRGGCRT